MKRFKKFSGLSALPFLFLLLMLVSGCEIMDMDEIMKEKVDEDTKPKTVLTVNMIVDYPRVTVIEREILTFSGRKVWINTTPFLHSKYIEDIELVPSKDKPDYFDLLLKLDATGRNIWISLVEEAKINRFGVVIDGIFYRTCEPMRMKTDDDSDEWVMLKGPYDPTTANRLKKNAKNNYKLLNDK